MRLAVALVAARDLAQIRSFTPCDSWPRPPASSRAASGAGCGPKTAMSPLCGTWRSGQPRRRCAGVSVRSGLRGFWRCSSPHGGTLVQFDFVTETRGLDYVAEVRNLAGMSGRIVHLRQRSARSQIRLDTAARPRSTWSQNPTAIPDLLHDVGGPPRPLPGVAGRRPPPTRSTNRRHLWRRLQLRSPARHGSCSTNQVNRALARTCRKGGPASWATQRQSPRYWLTSTARWSRRTRC